MTLLSYDRISSQPFNMLSPYYELHELIRSVMVSILSRQRTNSWCSPEPWVRLFVTSRNRAKLGGIDPNSRSQNTVPVLRPLEYMDIGCISSRWPVLFDGWDWGKANG